MSPDGTNNRFEPPPWEREAFERFRREREAQQDEAPAASGEERSQSGAEEVTAPAPESVDAGSGAGMGGPTKAEIDAMMLQLRDEVPEARPANKRLADVSAGLLAVIGLFTAAEGVMSLASSGADAPESLLAAATISIVMTAVGCGLVALGIVLFRKYHR